MAQPDFSKPSSQRIRVLLVDHHECVRRGLAMVLLAFDDVECIGNVAGGREAVALCTQLQPDVVLIELRPEAETVAAIRTIRRRWPHIKMIAHTTLGDEDLVEGALEAGVIACLSKVISAEQLIHTIRAVHAGRLGAVPDHGSAFKPNKPNRPNPLSPLRSSPNPNLA